MHLQFTKMSALGNDFIMVHGEQFSVEEVAPFAQQLCDRHFGIGADGIIFILASESADSKMRIINSDGSEAEMCGNGIRCFAQYLYEQGQFDQEFLSVETLAGIMRIKKVADSYEVAMGSPIILSESHQTVETSQGGFSLLPISMGNPHAVIVTETITDSLVLQAGPEIEIDSLFPDKSNVEFITVLDSSNIDMRVWERGCGETLACGTGACAAVVATIYQGLTDTNVTVHLLGGDLQISWSGNTNDSVLMTGGASTVFEGIIAL